ncbi:MAG: H-X9-DG-CTERM domain-containing protein [Verrucomicrobiota bacterium]|nr:H-X9-DG-CTERM domain-containing protein [Verrucomicrobiota bacterium]
MFRKQTNRKKFRILGFSLIEIMAVSAIVSSIPMGAYVRAKQMGVQIECVSNLRQIGQSYVMQYQMNGKYPSAAFFPDDPKKGKDSIRNVLSQGNRALQKMFVCPSSPEILAKKGLTFIFNDKWNNRRSLRSPDKAWVLVEINAASGKAPKPHPKGYNVLFADGHVKTVSKKNLPPSLTSKHKAELFKIENMLEEMKKASLDTQKQSFWVSRRNI